MEKQLSIMDNRVLLKVKIEMPVCHQSSFWNIEPFQYTKDKARVSKTLYLNNIIYFRL